MKVLKFGGTSVGQPESMKQVANIIASEKEPKIVVLSALSGTTNALVNIGEKLALRKITDARAEIENLYQHYLHFFSRLLLEEDSLARASNVVETHFGFIKSLLDIDFGDNYTKELLAQGELMSTKLFSIYLDEAGQKNMLLPALEFMAIDDNDEPNMDFISTKLRSLLDKHEQDHLFITQGYICLNALQQIDNLKRGGSDYTASLIGAAINADIIEIWTDIDGMHNNDPRVVEKTMPISNLSFEEAGELAYFGAKILHPNCIIPSQQYDIPVRIKNTMNPDAFGTLITSEQTPQAVKAIAAKDRITAIKIKSSRMIMAYGFLRKVFEVFEKYKTPIDMITTSEIAVSLTIDDDSHLPEIIEEIKLYGKVEVDKDQTIICIVGDMVAEHKGVGREIFKALENISIRMIAYGGSRNNISILVNKDYKTEALQALNSQLFKI